MERISVIRDKKMVPLLPGGRGSRIFTPARGLIVEKHQVGAIEIPEHTHESYCLHLQTSPAIDMEWWSEGGHGFERTEAGSMILLRPGTSDRLRWSGGSRRIVVSLEEDAMLRAAEELEFRGAPTFINRWQFHDPQLRLLLTELSREMESGWSTGPLYNDLLGMSLAVALLKKHAEAGANGTPVQEGLPKVRLQRVLAYVEQHSDRDLSLDDLARVAEMSRFHFSRMFRVSMGVTPYQYVLNQRLAQAKTLLRAGKKPVAEIAEETGFINASHFSRIFRKHVGVSPTVWKEQG